MATMKDVAREAGVSLGTVSNVLNNRSTVSEENRIKVINAVQKLKYRPNTAARTLKTKVSKSIGLIIPDINNPYYPEFARGVEDAAQKAGFTVFLCNSDRNIKKEREYIQVLLDKNVDGIVLVKTKISQPEIENVRQKCGVVLVDIDEKIGSKYDIVNVDDYEGSLKAMNLLYEYGHRRIGFISGIMDFQSSQRKYEAYIDFLKNKGLDVDESLIKEGSYDWYSGYTRTVELLSQVNPPTAIFASNDLMAIGAMRAIKERRLNIPFDISVVGYDDINMAYFCTPQLTTIRMPKYEMGMVSVETLIKRLGKSKKKVENQGSFIMLKTCVVFRESVGYASRR